jgi:CheY-like chemotaxis protein
MVMPKILIVEDNEVNRDMLSRRLARRGYAVICAEDGQQGVAMASSDAPDLILMDMSLPVLDGWEATKQIKASPGSQTIPVIALTAHALMSDRDQAIQAGCDDFETKPIDFPRLLGKVFARIGPGEAAGK